MDSLQELVLEPTEWCPLHCRHCSSASGPSRHTQLREEAALQLIRHAHQLGARQVSLGGGEPTGASFLIKILQLTDSLGMCSEVFTCGVQLHNGVLAALSPETIQEISSVRSTKLIFSLHGPNCEVHDHITQVSGSFECLEESLKRCLAADIHCEANLVPLRPNAKYLDQVVQWVESKGIHTLSILRFVPQGRGLVHRKELELSSDAEDLFVENVLRCRERYAVSIRTGSPFNGIVPGNVTACRAGYAKLVIQADGNVLPCEVFKHSNRREWNLSVYENSLTEILASAQLEKLHHTLTRNECTLCPVHHQLRREQRLGVHHERDEQLSQTAFCAQFTG